MHASDALASSHGNCRNRWHAAGGWCKKVEGRRAVVAIAATLLLVRLLFERDAQLYVQWDELIWSAVGQEGESDEDDDIANGVVARHTCRKSNGEVASMPQKFPSFVIVSLVLHEPGEP